MEINESILPLLTLTYIVAFVIFANKSNKSSGLTEKIQKLHKK